MANLIEIKKRISSISSTIKVTKVMHMIASAKVAKIKQKMITIDKYNNNADEVLQLFIKNTSSKINIDKFFVNNQNKKKHLKKLFVLFSSDKGTCGAINTNIYKEMISIMKYEQENGNDVCILPIGKRAVQFLQINKDKFKFNVLETKDQIYSEQFDKTNIYNIVKSMIDYYYKGDFDSINFVYHQYKNIITCFPVNTCILPLELDKIMNVDADYINIDETEDTAKNVMEFFVRTKIYNAYISNLASIFSSRMNAMDNATKNGKEIIDDLLVKYNKGRQAHITSELSDIVSGFEAIN